MKNAVPEPPNVYDALFCAIQALEKANEQLAHLALVAIKPPPNKALDRLLDAIPNLTIAYLQMQQQGRRDFEKRAAEPVMNGAMFIETLATFTEQQRTKILEICSPAQQKTLLDLFASVPVPIRPPAS